MNVYRDINLLPTFNKAVITTGSFDGVHVGHLQIIKQLLKEAENIGGEAVLITFYPHPQQIINKNPAPVFLLNTPSEKYELLSQNGIKNIVVVPFDANFSTLTAVQYIANFLVQKFKPSVIVVGYDHKFGKNRIGDFTLLKSGESKYHFKVKEIPEHILQEVTISSTTIRKALLEGDISTAAQFLGYAYFFEGVVVKGKQLGRTIGYPTANLFIADEHKLIPANAVYAVKVTLNKRQLYGMLNIGTRPTVNGKARSIEVNIFDFDEDIYGEILKITLISKLRNEIKFDGLDALKTQLFLDKIDAQAKF